MSGETRICADCGHEKPIAAFGASPDGSRCWTCVRAATRRGNARRRAQTATFWPGAPIERAGSPAEALAQGFRERGRLYAALAHFADDPFHHRRCLRAARDYETLARQAEAGITDDRDDA